jgi:hypothetical protein
MNMFAGLQANAFLPELYAESFGYTENVIAF